MHKQTNSKWVGLSAALKIATMKGTAGWTLRPRIMEAQHTGTSNRHSDAVWDAEFYTAAL